MPVPPWNPNRVLEDASLWGYDSHVDLAGLFRRKGSVLASLEIEGMACATFLKQQCEAHGLDPRGLVTRLQVEQSLVTLAHVTKPRQLNYALGFGATDSGDRQGTAGFVQQVQGYCHWWQSQRKSAEEWIGKPLRTSDGVVVHPENAATKLLYTYTPWVGQHDQHGNKAPFGNYLVWQVYYKFFPPAD